MCTLGPIERTRVEPSKSATQAHRARSAADDNRPRSVTSVMASNSRACALRPASPIAWCFGWLPMTARLCRSCSRSHSTAGASDGLELRAYHLLITRTGLRGGSDRSAAIAEPWSQSSSLAPAWLVRPARTLQQPIVGSGSSHRDHEVTVTATRRSAKGAHETGAWQPRSR